MQSQTQSQSIQQRANIHPKIFLFRTFGDMIDDIKLANLDAHEIRSAIIQSYWKFVSRNPKSTRSIALLQLQVLIVVVIKVMIMVRGRK